MTGMPRLFDIYYSRKSILTTIIIVFKLGFGGCSEFVLSHSLALLYYDGLSVQELLLQDLPDAVGFLLIGWFHFEVRLVQFELDLMGLN